MDSLLESLSNGPGRYQLVTYDASLLAAKLLAGDAETLLAEGRYINPLISALYSNPGIVIANRLSGSPDHRAESITTEEEPNGRPRVAT